MSNYSLLKKKGLFVPTLCNINEDTILTPKSSTSSISTDLENSSTLFDLRLNPQAETFIPTTKQNTTEQPENQKNVHKKMAQFIQNYKPRAKFNIYIGKGVTKQLISQISEPFPNTSVLYHYLDVSIAFQMTDNQMYIFKSTNHNQSTSFINFDLHAKNTNEPLYGIISPNDTEQLQNDSSIQIKWLWKLDCVLTAKEIYNKYNIRANELPKSSRQSHGLADYILNVNSETILNDSNVLSNIQWSRNNIKQIGKVFKYKKSSKVRKLKIELKTNNWIKICQEHWHDFPVIPIIVYDYENDVFVYWVEWIKLIKINICNKEYLVGISFKNINNVWKLQSLYLNRTDIANAHRLFGCFSVNYIKRLDDFETSIAEIQWL